MGLNKRSLEDMPWSEIVPRLTLFAVRLLKKRGKYDMVELAPDFAHTAIEKFYAGERKWDEKKNPDFFLFLASVVSSLIYHEGTKAARFTDIENVPEDQYSDDPINPSDAVLEALEVDKFLDFLRFRDRELYLFALLVWKTDVSDVERQASSLGVEVDQVPNLRRRLRRHIDAYRQKSNMESEK